MKKLSSSVHGITMDSKVLGDFTSASTRGSRWSIDEYVVLEDPEERKVHTNGKSCLRGNQELY